MDQPENGGLDRRRFLALAAAREADRELARHGRHPPPLLCGIPIGFKDIIAVGGKPLTAGSLALEGNIAPSDSHAWERARAEGMVLLGHTKTQEFASGNNTQTAGNPYDPRKSPGGSSNGSGAAVGACTVPVGLGTDSGGSLRRPASACGLNSLMATYGHVSTRGIVTGSRGNDHVGALVRSAVDVSLMLTLMSGRDPLDPTTYAAPKLPKFPLEARKGSRPFHGLRFALTPAIPAIDTIDPGVRAVFEAFVDDVRGMGAEAIEVTLPPQPAGAPGPSPEAVLLHRDLWPVKGHLYTRDAAARAGRARGDGRSHPLRLRDGARDVEPGELPRDVDPGGTQPGDRHARRHPARRQPVDRREPAPDRDRLSGTHRPSPGQAGDVGLMVDPTGFVPEGSPFVLVVPDRGTLVPPDPTGFVPPAGPFTFVVPDGGEDQDGDRPRRPSN